MTARTRDRFLPTAVGLVSRAWVVEEVGRRVPEQERRASMVDDLIGYEPPRMHGLRNMALFWATAIGASGVADALGLPPWVGFVAALMLFLAIARWLAVSALRWRLDRLLNSEVKPRPVERDPCNRPPGGR